MGVLDKESTLYNTYLMHLDWHKFTLCASLIVIVSSSVIPHNSSLFTMVQHCHHRKIVHYDHQLVV
jgi:hypothetical protein